MLPAVCVLAQGQRHLAGQVERVRHVQAARQAVLTMCACLRLAVQDQRLAVVLEIARQYLPGSVIVPAIRWAVIMYADLEKSTMPAANAAAMALNARLTVGARRIILIPVIVAVKLRMALNIGKNP